MRDLSENNLTEAVIAAMAGAQDQRTPEILASLVRHLHAFIREVGLTEAEWQAGIRFLTATGQKSDDRRQEFILLSDILGATTMKDFVNHPMAPGATEYTILGPFHRAGPPELPLGGDLASGIPGEPVRVQGRVLALDGTPLPGALLDVWQSDAAGNYDLQMPEMEGMALRGTFRTDAEGRYSFRTIKPSAYPIPFDGPVGQMLERLGRHPYRPAHIHFIVSAQGYTPVTTELFVEGDPYLDSDPVFGVRQSLVVPFVRRESSAEAAQADRPAPFYSVDFDFWLEPAR